ncbi:hypothetical protein KQI86_19210 [Clostridium sp. MSJ-11]|uniref:Phage protein n=1 Tax=Clostridium mobile TaxID=2841512 RepID=A0ABS6EN13_9CLOT|nr:hypothetical protein [Clostridium mobile]MBU5486433.1 hypothetical protein [Clostridium mobile]
MEYVYVRTLEGMIRDYPFTDTAAGKATVNAWQIALDIFKDQFNYKEKEKENVA